MRTKFEVWFYKIGMQLIKWDQYSEIFFSSSLNQLVQLVSCNRLAFDAILANTYVFCESIRFWTFAVAVSTNKIARVKYLNRRAFAFHFIEIQRFKKTIQ